MIPPLRILHCPTSVGGNPQQLARAERELGLESWSVALDGNPFGYEADEVLFPSGGRRVRHELARWGLLWRALRRYDVVHFNFGSSLLPSSLGSTSSRRYPRLVHRAYELYARSFGLRDLWLLKRAGLGIAVTFQGDDARQGGYAREHFEVHAADEADYYTPELDRRNRRRIESFARYADCIYALNPDLLHVLPDRARFVPYASVDPREWRRKDERPAVPARPLVLHAPTHRGVKGTRFVLAAVEQLRREGVPFDFELVENLSVARARELYARADLLVDQLLIGWYGGLAVELMALETPVIAYVREGDLGFVPERMRKELPVIRADPASIASVLRAWLTRRRGELRQLGARSRAFAQAWHDPLRIAERLREDYVEIAFRRRRGAR